MSACDSPMSGCAKPTDDIRECAYATSGCSFHMDNFVPCAISLLLHVAVKPIEGCGVVHVNLIQFTKDIACGSRVYCSAFHWCAIAGHCDMMALVVLQYLLSHR